MQVSIGRGAEQNRFMASDLRASCVQQEGRLDYTAVVKQTDGREVWSCEHITHHDNFSAMECANRELARRTAPPKDSQK
jgi:Zn-finger protein